MVDPQPLNINTIHYRSFEAAFPVVGEIRGRLQRLESVELVDANSSDTDFADQFSEVFTRMAKAQWKIRNNANLFIQKAEERLKVELQFQKSAK